jgi:tetratricopeptide (TPR) repeat protein
VKKLYLSFVLIAFSLIFSVPLIAEEPFPPKTQSKPSPQTVENPNFEKGYELYNQGKYDEAIVLFEEVLKIEPNHLRARVYYGVCFMGKNEFDRAIEELQKALKQDPNFPLTNYALAVSYARKAKPEPGKAEEYLAIAKKNGYQVPVWLEQYIDRLKSGNVPQPQKTT